MSDGTENSNSSGGNGDAGTDPASPGRRRLPARLRDSGIPLWQKLLVWAGAASVAGATVIVLFSFWLASTWGRDPLTPVLPVVFLIGLALSAGLWIWPLSRGGWRIVALFLSVPATLLYVAAIQLMVTYQIISSGGLGADPPGVSPFLLFGIMPLLAGAALAIVWIRAVLDFFASRRARRLRQTG